MDGMSSQTATRPRVLAVDDEPNNLELLERCLRRRYDVLTARTGEEGLAVLRGEAEIAAIISDYRMPGMNGAELLAASIDLHPTAKRIVITGYGEAENVVDAINSGRIHYFLRKPWDTTELFQALDRLLTELEPGGFLGFGGGGARKTERSNDIDALTGLYNHRAFHQHLTENLARAASDERPLALLYGDIDHFAALNGEIGYGPGDEVLRRVGEIVALAEDGNDESECPVVARYGGEEFALLLPGVDKDTAALRAGRLRAEIAGSAFPNGRSVTISFGVSAFPDDATEAEALVACAEGALWAAKRSGRNRVHLYRDDGSCARPGAGAPSPATQTAPTVSTRVLGEKFPTYHERLPAVSTALKRDRALSCLYIDLSSLRRIEIEHGIAKHGEVTASVGGLLDGLRGERLRKDDLICRTDDGEAYLCFLSPARTRSAHPARDLEAVATRVANMLQRGLGREIQLLTHERPHFVVGYARVLNNPMVHPERLIGRLITEAQQVAHVLHMQATQREKALLQEIILHEKLSPVYQPIVHLDSSEVFGFESLTRGPKQTSLESPAALFTVADAVDLTFELDRACFRGALRGAVGLLPVHRLFVNLLPLSFYDAAFIEGEVGKLLDAASLAPANIVFEITERLAIENFASFRRALAAYTAMGFGVAIDDVGTRHSNLESVMSLRPHFIKISDVLTRGVSRSTVKREMLRSLGRIAETIDAVVVAEGIETPDDLAVLCDLGVHYGQGFFLARPGPAFPTLRPAVRRAVRALARPRTPIPAPPADFDDNGDVHESFDNAVRNAVLERARRSGEIDGDGELLRQLSEASEDASPADEDANPAADQDESAAGNSPETASAPDEDAATAKMPALGREENAPATRASGTTVEDSEAWKPLRYEDLGGIRGEVDQVSLLDSLRHAPRPPEDTRDEETTSGGNAFP